MNRSGPLSKGALLAAGARLSQSQFCNIGLALLLWNLLQVGAAHESTDLDELSDEVVLPYASG